MLKGRWFVVALVLLAVGCRRESTSPTMLRQQVGPWRASDGDLFDDQFDFRPFVAYESDEPFAQKAMERLLGRAKRAHVVVLAQVVNVGEVADQEGNIRHGVVVAPLEVLKGSKGLLPDREQIALTMSEEQLDFQASSVMNRKVILFLRWTPAGRKDPYHWHLNLADDRFTTLVRGLVSKKKPRPRH